MLQIFKPKVTSETGDGDNFYSKVTQSIAHEDVNACSCSENFTLYKTKNLVSFAVL
jgi:hypothetical protein